MLLFVALFFSLLVKIKIVKIKRRRRWPCGGLRPIRQATAVVVISHRVSFDLRRDYETEKREKLATNTEKSNLISPSYGGELNLPFIIIIVVVI